MIFFERQSTCDIIFITNQSLLCISRTQIVIVIPQSYGHHLLLLHTREATLRCEKHIVRACK